MLTSSKQNMFVFVTLLIWVNILTFLSKQFLQEIFEIEASDKMKKYCLCLDGDPPSNK